MKSCGFEFEDKILVLQPWVNLIKLDVGLAVIAPNSEMWLSEENELLVFGFEPVSAINLAIEKKDSDQLGNLKIEGLILLSITYDNCALQDGAGAQLQRIIGIYAISKFFRINYIHAPLKEVLVHPNDGVTSDSQYSTLLQELNELVKFESSRRDFSIDEEVCVNHLGTKQFLFFLLRYRFSTRHLNLVVLQPYLLLNRFPRILAKFKKEYDWGIDLEEKLICVHIRQSGPDSSFILKGEGQSRNLTSEYYLEKIGSLRRTMSNSEFDSLKILIVTDEPQEEFNFKPYVGQEKVWNDAGYPLKSEGIRFRAGSTVNEIKKHFPNCEIQYGGSPVRAIKTLASGEYLVMSRSSLSHVAGLVTRTRNILSPPVL